jgi:hypothetical protein
MQNTCFQKFIIHIIHESKLYEQISVFSKKYNEKVIIFKEET